MPLTGLEHEILKSVASNAGKALTWIPAYARRKLSDVRAAKRLRDERTFATDLEAEVGKLKPSDASIVSDYLGSPEIGSIVLQIATKQLLPAQGGSADKFEAQIRSEVREGLSIRLPSHPAIALLTDAILRSLTRAVQIHLREVTPSSQSGMSPIARAAVAKSAADMTATASRNIDLLRELANLSAIDSFELEYNRALASVHGKIRLPHAGTARQVPYSDLFVDPFLESSIPHREDLLESGIPHREDRDSEVQLSLADLVLVTQRIVILGDPGGGKTTTTRKLLLDIASGQTQNLGVSVPIWITLREFAVRFQEGISILEFVEEQCRQLYSIRMPPGALDYILMNGRAIVFFDGLDELLDTSYRQQIVTAVEGFASRYATTQIVVTSRRVGYSEASLDDEVFTKYELSQFTEGQVAAYSAKWFNLDDSIENGRKASISRAFLHDAVAVQDLTSNPLMLSLMCALYASEGYIPRNRPDVYEKCATLLFEKWDKHRGIGQDMSFDAHVQSAIRYIAYRMYSQGGSAEVLSREHLINDVTQYLLAKRFDDRDEAEQAAGEFIDFCRGRAWVLTDVGAEKYGFAHRTFMEYFAASDLVRHNPSALGLLAALYPHLERSEWDVVAQLSVQLLGKSVSDGADDFLDALLDRTYELSNESNLSNLLSFAVRCLAFVVPRPPVLRRTVNAIIDYHCSLPTDVVLRRDSDRDLIEQSGLHTLAGELMSVAPENRKLVAKYMFDRLSERLDDDPCDQRALGLVVFLQWYGPGLSAGDGWNSFWASQRAEMLNVLWPYLELQGERFPWAASYLVMASKKSVSTMIEQLGPRSIYDYSDAGDLIRPPIAFRIVHRSVRVDQDENLRPEELVGEILESLLATATPWFSRDENFDSVGYQSDFRADDNAFTGESTEPLMDQLHLLLLMPIAELRVAHGPDDEEFTRRRLLRNHLSQVEESRLNSLPNVGPLYHQWARYNLSYLT